MPESHKPLVTIYGGNYLQWPWTVYSGCRVPQRHLHFALDEMTCAIGGIIVHHQYVHLVLHAGALLVQGINERADVVAFVIGRDDNDDLYGCLP